MPRNALKPANYWFLILCVFVSLRIFATPLLFWVGSFESKREPNKTSIKELPRFIVLYLIHDFRQGFDCNNTKCDWFISAILWDRWCKCDNMQNSTLFFFNDFHFIFCSSICWHLLVYSPLQTFSVIMLFACQVNQMWKMRLIVCVSSKNVFICHGTFLATRRLTYLCQNC